MVYYSHLGGCTCFHFHLNLKYFSVKGFAVARMEGQFPSVARDDTKWSDGLLDSQHFLSCNLCVTAGAFKHRNKDTWMRICVHHTMLQAERKHTHTDND